MAINTLHQLSLSGYIVLVSAFHAFYFNLVNATCYTLSIANIRINFLILSSTPPSLNLSGHGLYKVSKAFHRDAGPC